MSDDDLIRRAWVEIAIRANITKDDDRYAMSRAIAALPAVQPAPDLTANAALAAQLAEACARADRAETQVTAMSEELEAAYREIEALRKGG